MKLSRRSFVGGALAAPFLAKPGFGQAKGSVLRVIPHADLKNIDPIWTTAYISRNHGYMVYDTLFAMDTDLKPQPQMVDKWETSADGKTWTFVLRDGLSFHDGKPVTAADCAASLTRWGKRDPMGQLMFTAVESCTGRDAKTLEIKLTRPYGLLIELDRERSPRTCRSSCRRRSPRPTRSSRSKTRSAPGRSSSARSNGCRAPRSSTRRTRTTCRARSPPRARPAARSPRSIASSGSTSPIPTTCMNALMSGEVDYYEQVPADLAPMLAKAPGVKIETLDPIGSQGMMRFNHLVAPTNNPLVRRAIMRAVNQKDVLAAAIGNPEYYKECTSIYPCGSPFETNAGTELAFADRHRRGEEAARGVRLQGREDRHPAALRHSDLERLRAGGRQGLPRHRHERRHPGDGLVVGHLAPRQEGPGRTGRLEHVPDLVDRRRPAQSAEQCLAGRRPEQGLAGLADRPKLEELRAAFAAANGLDAQKKAAADVQARAIEIGTAINLGVFFVPVGYRDNVKGMIPSPVQFFWNMEKVSA